MASLKSGTTIGTYTAIHTNNISSYALTSVPSNVITTSGGQTIAGITYFSNGESLNLYGIRGRFTNEYIHLYNKVGIGHPSGWGQGEGNTPAYGLSTYGGMNIAYGSDNGATINTYTRINKNWGGGDYAAEQLTIRGTYPSITLRSTQHDSKWLIHHADSLQFYFGGTVDNNSWSNKIQFATDGNIWSAYYGDWLSNIFNSKQNASTAITTSNIGSQSVSYASSAGTAGQVSGVSVSATEMNRLKTTLGSTGLPYSCDIYVEGDPNTYYPVHFIWGDQDVWRRIIIKRGYSEEAPWDPIGTGAHHGGLLLDWEGNFGGWGGAEYSDRLRVFNESYTNVCADMYIYTHSMGYVFMLRGGHALYHIFSDQEIRGYHQVGTPDIAYSTSTLFYDHSIEAYKVYAPAPVTSVNSSRIDGLRTKKQSLFDNRYQQISTAINTGNIGSQSVNYANTAGRAYPRRSDGTNINFYWSGQSGQPTWLWGSNDGENFYVWNPSNFSVNYATSAGNSDTLDSLDSSEFARGRAAYQVLNLDTIKQPGLYQYDGGIGGTQPEGADQANLRTIEIGSGGRYSQMAFDWNSEQAWFRRQTGSTWSAWREFIHSGNIASQSVSYADESGYSASSGSVEWTSVQNKPDSFTPSSHTHDDRYYTESEIDSQISNRLYQVSVGTFNVNDFNGTGLYRGSTGSWSNRPTVVHNGGAVLQIDTHPGNYHSQLFFDTGGDRLYFRNANAGTWGSWLTIIHSGNIGSQSVSYASSAGNADTVDGYHESAFWRDGQDRRIGALRFSGEGGNSGNGVIAYGIFQEGGDWTHPYPDLRIAFHTGIKLGANAGYEGIRFYTDYDMSSQVMSVNNGSDPLGQGNVYVNNSLQAGSSLRAPIFYDSNDTTYYGDFASTSYLRHLSVGDVNASNDGSWNARLNLTGSSHARLDVKSNSDGIITTMFSHTGQGVGRVGTMSNHPLAFMVNGSVAGYAYANYLQGVDSVRAPIFYDSNDTGYYLDPNGTSNLLQLTTATRARWNMPRVWYDRSSRTSDQGYWTGTNGWGAEDGTWANAWKGGFSGWDIWGSNTDHPQGAGSIHAQGIVSGIHYSSSDGSAAYGWMMVGANGAVANRYWLRGKWDTTTSSWVEMITTGNIASQSVSYADESGFAASAGSVEWTSVQNKPATFTPSSHTHAISDVTGLQTALDGKQASGSYAAASHTHAIADVTGLQAALDGKQAAGSYAAASHTHTFASLTSKPTTISGYGITDAITTGNIGSQSVSSASGVSITGFGDNSFTYHQTPGNVHGWTGGWASHFIGNHGNGDTYYSQSIIMPFWGVPRYQRNEGGNKVGPWQFITEENIATQSVSFATTSGSATSSTTANRLDNYGINYGSDWNTWGVYGKLVASSYHNASGANKPPTYTYGSFLSFLNSGADSFQIAIPENQWNGTGKERAMHYRSAWNGTWSSWRQVVDIQNNVCDILADGTSTLIVRQGVGYNQPFSSNIEIHGSVDDWAYGKFRFRVQNESGTEPVYGAQFRIERFSVNTGWQLLGMVPRGSQNLEWQGDILPGLSDQRVKENVVSLTDGVATVQQINPVEFDWKPVENVSEREGHDIGFIAQQLEEIVPTAVHTRSDGYKTVKYEKVVPILVQAIKEQQAMIEQLSARLSALEQK